MAIHTTSTKCQDSPQISTLSETCGPRLPRSAGGRAQHHEEGRHQEDEGADRGERDVQDLVRGGPADALALVGQVGADERPEEHALRAQEGPHAHLPVVEPGRADVRVVHGVRGFLCAAHEWGSSGRGRWYSGMNLTMQ